MIVTYGAEECTLCGEHIIGMMMRWYGYGHDIVLCARCAADIRRDFTAELATLAELDRIRRGGKSDE